MFCCDAAQLLMLRDTQTPSSSLDPADWVGEMGLVGNVLVAIHVVGHVCS